MKTMKEKPETFQIGDSIWFKDQINPPLMKVSKIKYEKVSIGFGQRQIIIAQYWSNEKNKFFVVEDDSVNFTKIKPIKKED
jgi:hypothetical protein